MEEVFQGPAWYRGIPASNDEPSTVGHINIWSAPPTRVRSARLGCPDHGDPRGVIGLRGRTATWVYCPEGLDPPQDSGHIVLQWVEGGYLNAVSVHGDTSVNRQLALAVAQAIDFTYLS